MLVFCDNPPNSGRILISIHLGIQVCRQSPSRDSASSYNCSLLHPPARSRRSNHDSKCPSRSILHYNAQLLRGNRLSISSTTYGRCNSYLDSRFQARPTAGRGHKLHCQRQDDPPIYGQRGRSGTEVVQLKSLQRLDRQAHFPGQCVIGVRIS
jgi:hypothetical protein